MFQSRRIALAAGTTILVLIIAVIFITGLSDIKRAEIAMQKMEYASATGYYLKAIQILPWRKDLWEKAGLAASANSDYKNAISYLVRAPELSEEGWVVLGFSYVYTGNLTAALDAYQHGLQAYDSASLYAGLAYIFGQQKNWKAESEALKNQTRLDGKNVYAHYRLGLLLMVLDPGHALPELMLASSLEPEIDSAVQTLRAALNLSATQSDPSQQMLTIGRALGLVQEWELAVSSFDQATRFDPQNAEAWAWLGEAKQQTGQDGRVELNRAGSLGQSSVIVHALRGQYWNRQKEYSRMLQEYQHAAELEPDNPAWQVEMGNAYSKNGDLATAFLHYQHATELAPNDSTYWRLMAVFCAENGVYVEDAGLPAARKAVELAPNDPLNLDALGFAYLSSGRYANAEQILLDAINRFPDSMPSHFHLALTYLAQGNKPDAFTQLTFVSSADTTGDYGTQAEKLLAKYFR